MYRSRCGTALNMKKNSNSSIRTETASVTMSFLQKRMAEELYYLAKVSTEVETALGDVIGQSKLLNDELITALQGLDRIRQNLEDFARLSTLFSSVDKSLDCNFVLISEIKKHVVLSELVMRLTNSVEAIPSKANLKQDVFWL